MQRHRIALLVLLATSACNTTGTVTEIRPAASLGAYEKVAVFVKARDPSMKNAELMVSTCQAAIPQQFLDRRTFPEILDASNKDKSDLIIEIIIQDWEESIDPWGSLRRDETVYVSVNLVDPSQQAAIAELTAMGNSKSNSVNFWVAGVDVASFGDQLERACERVGEHLSRYMIGKR